MAAPNPPLETEETLPGVPSAEEVVQATAPPFLGMTAQRFPEPPAMQTPPPPQEKKIISGIGVLSNRNAEPSLTG